ncbi:MAG: PRD domain-containing protein [Butyricicoccus sp.]|nr:PRD domain-containing protein [Butyricicoccus sp.]
MTAAWHGQDVYRISRVIGNNFVCITEPDGREVILRGLGIGFKKQPGDLVPAQKVEKIYDLRDPEKSSRLMELLGDVPAEFLDVSTEIIETAEKAIGRRLSENIYITLTDHICFAVERLRTGAAYPNQLLWEITNFYPSEFAVGEQALDIIEQRLGYRLSRDEAGFIALHIVNAEIDGKMSDMVRITELISSITATVQAYYGVALDEQSLDYGRFITHLKFLGQRITQNQYSREDDAEFQTLIVRRYEYDYHCAERIRDRLLEEFSVQLPPEEMIFLTIHLHRLALTMGITEKEE